MSRRERQADLRRRMAEARAKLASAASSAGTEGVDDDDDDDDDENASPSPYPGRSRKRPHPGGGVRSGVSGGGGILRRSKYVVPGKRKAPVRTNSDRDGDDKGGGLGALVGGYGSDSSSSSDADYGDDVGCVGEGGTEATSEVLAVPTLLRGEKEAPPSTVAAPAGKNSSSSSPPLYEEDDDVTGEELEQEELDSPKSPPWNRRPPLPRVTFRCDAPEGEGDVDADGLYANGHINASAVTDVLNEATDPEVVTTKSKEGGAALDEAWEKFNALVDADADEGLVETAAGDGAAREKILAAEEVAATTKQNVTHKKKGMKKKKKKKKKKSLDGGVEAAEAAAEQASYEARLGRLILMRVEKKGRTNATKASASLLTFYDPVLAFREEDDNEEDGDNNGDDGSEGEKWVENSATLAEEQQRLSKLPGAEIRGNGQNEEDSEKVAKANAKNDSSARSALAEPFSSTSLAAILRRRRWEARVRAGGRGSVRGSTADSKVACVVKDMTKEEGEAHAASSSGVVDHGDSDATASVAMDGFDGRWF